MAAKNAVTEVEKPKEEKTGGEGKRLRSTWPRLHQWVSCICVVTFDLELGQAIEVRYQLAPPEVVTPLERNLPVPPDVRTGGGYLHSLEGW